MASAYFLEPTPDAQLAGMAGTKLAATGNDSTAIFHNASTITFSREVMGASCSYARINQDCALHSTSLFYRIGKEGIYGFVIGFRHFRDPEVLDYHPHVWDLEAACLRDVAENLSLPLMFRYLQAEAAESIGSKGGVCLDFGATYYRDMALLDEMASWSTGFQATNLGRKLDGQKLPAGLRLGNTIDLPFSTENRLQVALGSNYLFSSEIRHLQISVGTGYNFLKYGVIRAGYHFGDKNKGVGNYDALGCGINFWLVRADFSYALVGKDCFMRRT